MAAHHLSHRLSGSAERLPHCYFRGAEQGGNVCHLHPLHVAQAKNGLLFVGQPFHHLHHLLYALSLLLVGRRRYVKIFNPCGVLPTADDADAKVSDDDECERVDRRRKLIAQLPHPQHGILHHIFRLVLIAKNTPCLPDESFSQPIEFCPVLVLIHPFRTCLFLVVLINNNAGVCYL